MNPDGYGRNKLQHRNQHTQFAFIVQVLGTGCDGDPHIMRLPTPSEALTEQNKQ